MLTPYYQVISRLLTAGSKYFQQVEVPGKQCRYICIPHEKQPRVIKVAIIEIYRFGLF